MPADLQLVRRLRAWERGLATVATTRADGSVKLRHLRERARTTVVFRSGWPWVTVEGPADLASPGDPSRSRVTRVIHTIAARLTRRTPSRRR